MKRVLAIGAHPDDIEFGCGGTLIKHKNQGDKTHYLCMTSGESVDGVTGKTLRTAQQHQSEIEDAINILGCDSVFRAPLKDLHVPFSFETVNIIEREIKTHNIDTIYTHWAGDANQDHIATFKATMAAARYVPNVFCYEQIPVPRMSENQMNINYYVNITREFNDKIEASLCHNSQIVKYKSHGFDVEENLTTLAKFRGIQADYMYAEAFQVIKQIQI